MSIYIKRLNIDNNHKTEKFWKLEICYRAQYSNGGKKLFSRKFRFLQRVAAAVSLNKKTPQKNSARPFYAEKIRSKVGNFDSLMPQKMSFKQ